MANWCKGGRTHANTIHLAPPLPRIITITPNPTYDFAVDADFVAPNRKLRCKNPHALAGGGGINVARAAGRLGAEAIAIFTAGGLYGAELQRLVAAENIQMRAIGVAGATRLAFHVKDEASGEEYRFNLPGAEMSAREQEAMLAAIEDQTRAGDFVVGSGSLPPMAGESAAADFWARAARIAKDKGARFVLDSISGLDAAMAEGVFLLRQNEHELVALARRRLKWPDEVSAFAREIVASGAAGRMVISHGSEGSVMASAEGVVSAPVHDVETRSAVGAGDSFVAALLVAMIRGWSDADALGYAAAGAAATRMAPGAALFRAEEVERLYRAAHLN